MTYNEIVKAVKKHVGKIQMSVPVVNDSVYMVIEKKSLIEAFSQGNDMDMESDMTFNVIDGNAYIDPR
jgi:hypothetical protein